MFNHIARDGYGWGLVLALGFERAPGGSWRRSGLSVKPPPTLAQWEGDATLLHGGMRWWIRKEKFAIDIALQHLRAPGSSSSGLVIGVGWYDL